MAFILVLGKPNKELTVHEAREFHSRLCFVLGLPTPLIFDRQVFASAFGIASYDGMQTANKSLKLVLFRLSEVASPSHSPGKGLLTAADQLQGIMQSNGDVESERENKNIVHLPACPCLGFCVCHLASTVIMLLFFLTAYGWLFCV